MENLTEDDFRYQTETHQLRVTLSTPLGGQEWRPCLFMTTKWKIQQVRVPRVYSSAYYTHIRRDALFADRQIHNLSTR